MIIIHVLFELNARESMMFEGKCFLADLFFRRAALAIALGVVGCSSGNPAPETTTSDRPEVVVSNSILCDLTQQIARDRVELNCLMEPEQDPHSYRTTPGDRQAMETAALILYGGYELVPTIEGLVEAIETPAPKVAVYEAAVPDPILAEHHHHEDEKHASDEDEEHHHHDEEEKDTDGEDEELEPDPHVWHDVRNAIAIVEEIEFQLVQIDPEQTEFYGENATQLKEELDALDGWVKAQVATIPSEQRTLITTHDGFNYYIRAYGFKNSAALQGLSTEEQPTAAQLKALVEKVEAAKVPTIFAEVTANDRVIGTVAREAGVRVADGKLLTGGLGAEGRDAETYTGAIAANTCTIVNGLGGQCTPFQSR